jgi:hypothetical protein
MDGTLPDRGDVGRDGPYTDDAVYVHRMNPIRATGAVILAAVIIASLVHAAETAWYLPPAAVITCASTWAATRLCVDRSDRRRRP